MLILVSTSLWTAHALPQINNTSNPGASGMLMNVPRCCRASCAHTAKRHRLAGCLPAIAIQLSPRRRMSRPDRDGNHTSLPEWNKQGLQGCLSSQALVPHATLVAHSLSYGLWAGKYGFMCAHITFGSRETFKSNYGECYLHELLF